MHVTCTRHARGEHVIPVVLGHDLDTERSVIVRLVKHELGSSGPILGDDFASAASRKSIVRATRSVCVRYPSLLKQFKLRLSMSTSGPSQGPSRDSSGSLGSRCDRIEIPSQGASPMPVVDQSTFCTAK